MYRQPPYRKRRAIKYKCPLYFLLAVLLIALSACSGKQDEEHSSHHEHPSKTEEVYLATIAQSTNKYVISDQKTVKVGAVPGESEFSGTGYIRNDERRNVKVAARFEGRIEELHVKYNYAYVRKGQPIMELYSPTINTIQQELRYLRQHPDDTGLLEQTRKRMRLLGLSNRQVREIETSKIPKSKVEIESPAEGFVLFSDASAEPAAQSQGADQGNGMGSMGDENGGISTGQSAVGSRAGVLRKGDYVKAGQTLFKVNDYRVVWAILLVDARHQAQLKEGTPVKVYSDREPARYAKGKIDLIEPVYESGQKFVTVRVYLPNKDLHFKENALVRAMIAIGSKEALTVPNTALLDLGRKKVVWLLTGKTPQGKKIFEAIEVKTGRITANTTEIISGLKEEQEIASDAGLLTDSESMINAAALKE